MPHLPNVISRNQHVQHEVLTRMGVSLHVKREDEIHPEISGNKWRKLRYHILEAKKKKSLGILTYGGAFSNHIAATAFAAQDAGLQSIGIIRGERIEPLNPTLSQATAQGMDLYFVSRTAYRTEKESLANKMDPMGDFHHVPEGGADELGVRGCQEILTDSDRKNFDTIACSSGTGTTATGLYKSMAPGQRLKVYPALKGDFACKDIEALLHEIVNEELLQVHSDYHFGGYAKTDSELFNFMREFYAVTRIRTDPVYTAKMFYGLLKDVEQGRIERGSSVLAIHTGGLQGIRGIELRDDVCIFAEDWTDI